QRRYGFRAARYRRDHGVDVQVIALSRRRRAAARRAAADVGELLSAAKPDLRLTPRRRHAESAVLGVEIGVAVTVADAVVEHVRVLIDERTDVEIVLRRERCGTILRRGAADDYGRGDRRRRECEGVTFHGFPRRRYSGEES